jgi:hypothetical protein
MLNTILTKIPGVASAKDSMLGMVVKPHVQEYLGYVCRMKQRGMFHKQMTV